MRDGRLEGWIDGWKGGWGKDAWVLPKFPEVNVHIGGEWRMVNSEWRMVNSEWRMENGE